MVSNQAIVELISSTTTETGLIVFCELDPNPYPRGVAVTDDQMASLNLARADFHGEWNYTSGPHKSLGVERRFLNQDSEAPFDCQAISSSPSRKHPRRPAVSRTAELLTPPLAFL